MIDVAIRTVATRLVSALVLTLPLIACGGGSDVEIGAAADSFIATGDSVGSIMPTSYVVGANDVSQRGGATAALTAQDPTRPVSATTTGSGAKPGQTAPDAVQNAKPDAGGASAGSNPGDATTPQRPPASSSTDKTPADASASVKSDIGLNIHQVAYYDQSFMYADLARHAKITNSELAIDGTPKGDFNLFIDSRTLATGTYKLSFRGRATLSANLTDGSVVRNQHYDATTNTTTADVVVAQLAKRNKWIVFTNTRRTGASTTADGVTDIQLWRPGYPTDGSVLLTKEFIEAMQPASVLRVMNMTSTNLDRDVTWAERRLPSYQSNHADHKQAWEMIVQIANLTNKDVWINAPMTADDDYFLQLARLFRYGSDGVKPYTSAQKNPVYPPLNSNLKLYVEFHNELWNTGFKSYHLAVQIYDKQIKDNPKHPANLGGPTISGSFVTWAAWRSAVLSKTFRAVFGDDAMMTRVRPILATQFGNAFSRLQKSLEWAEGYYGVGSAPTIWYGGGGAPYFGVTEKTATTSATEMAAYFSAPVTEKWLGKVQKDVLWTKAYGLKTIAYEGGPEPGFGQSGTTVVADTYNNDPRMAEYMGRHWDAWKALGGDMFAYFSYAGAGHPWLFNDVTKNPTVADDASVKMEFLKSLPARQPVATTFGALVPATIRISDVEPIVGKNFYGGTASTYGADNRTLALRADGVYKGSDPFNLYVAIPVRTASAQRVRLSLAAYDAAPGTQAQIWVNGVLAGEVAVGESSPRKTLVHSAKTAAVTLPKGVSVVRVRMKAGVAQVRDLVVQAAD